MIGFEGEWVDEDPDGRLCRICKDPIYSLMHVFYIFTLVDQTAIIALCDHCFNLPDEEE